MPKSRQMEPVKNVFTKKDNISTSMDLSDIEENERKRLHYYISLVQNHPDLLFVFSREGDLLTDNYHKLNKLLGFRARKKLEYKKLIPKQHYETIAEAFDKALHGTPSSIRFDMLNNAEEYQHFITTIVPLTNAFKEVEAVAFMIKDITEQTKLDLANKNKLRHLEKAQDIANFGSWEYDLQHNKFTSSKTLYRLIGINPTEILTEESILPLLHPDDRMPLLTFIKQTLETKRPSSFQFRLYHGQSNELRHVEIIVDVDSMDGEPVKFIGVVKDITHEIEMKKQLEHYAKYDAVTDLPNYYSLYEKLDELISDQKIERFALIYLDLDNFHWIVNHLGHETSDKMLKIIARRLGQLCPVNGFLAKERDDSFVYVIYNYPDEQYVTELVNKVMQHVAKKIVLNQYEFHLTTSIGISFYPKHATDKLLLFEQAHSALKYAKKLGKNNYQIYAFKEDLNAHKRYSLEKDLRQAIENDELDIYYQPVVNPATNAMIGAEALIRWNNKTWGIVQPEEFMSLAEEKHLINDIFEWQIKKVFEHLDKWKNRQIPLYPISINISPLQLLQPGIIHTLVGLLDKYNISPRYIILEITERSPLPKDVQAIETLKKMKQIGIKLAIDDFGTGYSSFQSLQQYDFDIIKIDQSFIQNLVSTTATETKEAAIVTSFLHIAESLGLRVVAEGVEEYEQLAFLSQKECDAIQGYIYSKPVPADEFEKLMIRRYLMPLKQKRHDKDGRNMRRYFRFEFFPNHVVAKMYITKTEDKQVNIGYAFILLENISIGGIRFLSNFKIPVVSALKLRFEFKMMGEWFNLDGKLVYQNKEADDLYAYGVSFNISEGEQHRLAKVINQMTVLRKLNEKIPDTDFVTEKPNVFLHNVHARGES